MSSTLVNERLRGLSRRAEDALAKYGQLDVLVVMHHMLSHGRVASLNAGIEEVLLEHGRPYIGIAKPKGIRKGRVRRCFMNSFCAAEDGHGVYVEGLAFVGERLVHHAWITSDGSNAIEVTWRPNVVASYFGVPFSKDLHNKFINLTQIACVFSEEGGLPIHDVLRHLRDT